jgi:hypothetical protein
MTNSPYQLPADDEAATAQLWAWAGERCTAGEAATPMAALEDLVDAAGRIVRAAAWSGVEDADAERVHELGLRVLGH